MEKHENIRSWNDVLKMDLDDVLEFHNEYKKMISNGGMTEEGFVAKFGFALGTLFNYVYAKEQYSCKGGYLKKQPKSKKSKKQQEEKPVLTDAEILALKNFLANEIADIRSCENEELVAGDKTAKQCIYFVDEVDQKFKNYCQTHKRFNRSEHVMLALLEYMEKYK